MVQAAEMTGCAAGRCARAGWRKRAVCVIMAAGQEADFRVGEVNMSIARILAGRSADSVISVHAGHPVREAIALLAKHRIGALPVIDGPRCIGVFSERDVIYCLAREGAAALDKPVSELMTGSPVTVSPDTDVIEALTLVTRRRVRHLPVIEGQDFVGFVSIGDLVKFRIEEVEKEAQAMLSYIQMA